MVEGAPLLREYGFIAHRGFESLPLRQLPIKNNNLLLKETFTPQPATHRYSADKLSDRH